ncbi:DUF6973 domain-containing protein [Formosa sp. PL04]|uniref:DUF6973 domain-containing protein n=1 Tax=Formosa sp. PL04 TaxID=3081755 RepID=UPI0029812741|nr:hypothetical protein [Formosa sp. PL04]MDW5290839.1 hypothetical protein [Formosa sp. PL04]
MSGGGGSPPGDDNDDDDETVGLNPPRNVDQEILNCFSSVGLLVDTSSLTFNQRRNLANYLRSDNNDEPFDFSGTNCSDPEALMKAYLIYQAMIEGGDVNFEDLIYVLENEQEYTDWMSNDEKNLFLTLNKSEQLLYLASAKHALDETENRYLTLCERYNGKGDAFRHAYWNALSSSRIGVGLTNLLTTRHENKPPEYPYHWKENEMDLFNNRVGRDIIANGSTNILQDLQDAINNGNLRYLNNQGSNCFATFSSQLTPTNQ